MVYCKYLLLSISFLSYQFDFYLCQRLYLEDPGRSFFSIYHDIQPP